MKLMMVPVTDTDEGWRALRVALMVARRFDGHADAVFIQPHIEVEVREFLPGIDQDLRVGKAEDRVFIAVVPVVVASDFFDESWAPQTAQLLSSRDWIRQ